MVWPALIAAGANLLGGVMQNKASAKQAQIANEFSERMASTQHQREVTDLRAAGLNPILSATGGMGSFSPTGQQAPVQNVIGPAVSSATDYMRSKSQSDLNSAQARQKEPYALLADFASRVLDRLLPASPGARPATPAGPAIPATPFPYHALPDPIGKPLEWINKRRDAMSENFDPRGLNKDADYRDYYNFMRRGFFDNSAKSTYEDSAGKIHYNLTPADFHSYARRDPRYYDKYYKGKNYK